MAFLHVNIDALHQKVRIDIAETLSEGYRVDVWEDASGCFITAAKMRRSLPAGELTDLLQEPITRSLDHFTK